MSKSQLVNLAKLIVILTLVICWGISARVIYQRLVQATRINPELVAIYRPSLDVTLVKKAANVLEEREARLKKVKAERTAEVKGVSDVQLIRIRINQVDN